jgi:hypothetical protein
MMTLTSRLVAVALASLLFTGTALAQATAPAAKSDTAATAEKKAPQRQKERTTTAESRECSKQADAKGLKGTERRKFRRECIRSARAGTAAPATTAPAEKTK